jgi:hypothetical protein
VLVLFYRRLLKIGQLPFFVPIVYLSEKVKDVAGCRFGLYKNPVDGR